MYVDRDRKVAFICHPRTASLAISKVFHKIPLERIGDHHGVNPKIIEPGWRVACVLRNPIDCLVSWYFHHRHFEGSFEDWLKVMHYKSKWLACGMFYGMPFCTHFLRFEHLQRDFFEFCDEVGWPKYSIPQYNVSKNREGRSWKEFAKFVKPGHICFCQVGDPYFLR